MFFYEPTYSKYFVLCAFNKYAVVKVIFQLKTLPNFIEYVRCTTYLYRYNIYTLYYLIFYKFITLLYNLPMNYIHLFFYNIFSWKQPNIIAFLVNNVYTIKIQVFSVFYQNDKK